MKFMKIKEFSKDIGLPVTTLREMAKNNAIPALKQGTIYFIETDGAKAKIAEILDSRTVKPRMSFMERLSELK